MNRGLEGRGWAVPHHRGSLRGVKKGGGAAAVKKGGRVVASSWSLGAAPLGSTTAGSPQSLARVVRCVRECLGAIKRDEQASKHARNDQNFRTCALLDWAVWAMTCKSKIDRKSVV